MYVCIFWIVNKNQEEIFFCENKQSNKINFNNKKQQKIKLIASNKTNYMFH